MNQSTVVRPAGITAIAWLWIVGGILLLVGALLTWALLSMIGSMTPLSTFPGKVPADSEFMNLLLRNVGVFVLVQVAIGVASIYAGAQLLKLRAWARTAVEVLTWVSLVYVLVNGALFLYMWDSIAAWMPPEVVLIDPAQLRMLGLIVGVVVTVAFAIPLGFTIKYLRGPVVRQAIAAANQK